MSKSNGTVTKYMEKYFDEKFGNIIGEIKEVKAEIKVIKNDLKKNGKCMSDMNTTMLIYKGRVRNMTIALGFIIIILFLGVMNGITLITKGILSFF